jgi:1,2-diacylglycerol 3-alpha-glucosyltransferase
LWWREWIKSWRVRKFSSALVGGKSHADYLIKLGFDPKKISFGYDVVDNAAFHPDRIGGLPNPCPQSYFLSVNRFVQKKNITALLESYAEYRRRCHEDPWDLVLCGNGPMQSEIEQTIARNKLAQFVHLPGFLKQNALLPYFAHAACFVHASIEEQWGLVVNEALAAGLPVLVSNRCGCYADLLSEGKNGFGFDPRDLKALSSLMLKMHSNEVDLTAMGNMSLERSKHFPASRFGDGLIEAVELGLTANHS